MVAFYWTRRRTLPCLEEAAASSDAGRTAQQGKISPTTYSILDSVQENT